MVALSPLRQGPSLLLLVLSACSSLPAAGPDTSEIYAASKPQDDGGLGDS